MPRRVKRPETREELFNLLTDTDQTGVFETYKDVMIFAAALAAYKDKSEVFDKSSEPIDYNIFSKSSDNEALIHLLAIYKEDNIEILAQQESDQRVEILENYANAGLGIINQKINSSATILDAIIDLIYEVESDDDANVGRDFTKIINMFKN